MSLTNQYKLPPWEVVKVLCTVTIINFLPLFIYLLMMSALEDYLQNILTTT